MTIYEPGCVLVESDELEYEVKLHALREAAQVGWDDLDNGRYFEVRNDDDNRTFWDAVHREVELKRRPSAQ